MSPRIVCAVVAGVISLAGPVESVAQFPVSRTLPVIIRDVVADTPSLPAGIVSHPDFGGPATGLVTGEVLPTLVVNPLTALGAIRPSPSATTFGIDTFDTWFLNSAYNASVGGATPVVHTFTDALTMTHLGSGVYQFKDATFDPLNGRGFGNVSDPNRNAHFTVEGHWMFRYNDVAQPTLRVCADDSLWVFINSTLVVDLGGVRGFECRVVPLAGLGLANLQSYAFDLFYADRAGTLSAFELTTNLDLFQQWRDDEPPAPGLSAVTLDAVGPAGADVQAVTLGARDLLLNPPAPAFTACLEPFGAYPVGTHQFHCTAADEWGNQTAFVSSVMVQDLQAPALTPVADIHVQAEGETVSVTWNTPTATDVVSGNLVVSCSPSSGAHFSIGTTAVECTAVDDAGNLGRTTFAVHVAPAPPPPPDPIDSDDDGVADEVDPFIHSNLDARVRVGSCSTQVANLLLADGATFNDLIAAALSGARRHGGGVSAVTALARGWQRAGFITGREHGMIVSCAGRNNAPETSH